LRSHSDAVKERRGGGREKAGRRRAASRLSFIKLWLFKGSETRERREVRNTKAME
jgi:hypothetical protein